MKRRYFFQPWSWLWRALPPLFISIPQYGFVNTEKILESFGESQKASGEIRVEEERWLTEARIIEDSLAAFEARIQKD